jgi:hypothetical protein
MLKRRKRAYSKEKQSTRLTLRATQGRALQNPSRW